MGFVTGVRRISNLHLRIVGLRRLSCTSKLPQRGNTTNNKNKSDSSLNRLKGIISNMTVSNNFPYSVRKSGASDIFSYAMSDKNQRVSKQAHRLVLWETLMNEELKSKALNTPLNGFEELIQLTEQGKLWKYPIDNEQGMDEEKAVPFEEHVFLDVHIEDFPNDPNIRAFMSLIIGGLGRNHWMTADRKREIIRFFRDYFSEKRDLYKQAGYEI